MGLKREEREKGEEQIYERNYVISGMRPKQRLIHPHQSILDMEPMVFKGSGLALQDRIFLECMTMAQVTL